MMIRILTLLLWFACVGGVLARDMPLSEVLIEGAGWQVVSEGHGFTDGLCSDADGNVYFSDVRSGQVIYKVDLDGKVSEFVKKAAGISGLQWGADGKLYACLARGRMVVRFDQGGKMEILAKEVRPNDLVVTYDGNVYFTQTPEQEIVRIDPKGKMTVVSKGVIVKPNGITLSPDQGTLAVSDYGGKYVWVFRIEKEGTLSYPQNYMTMRTANGKPEVAKGDGMATDAEGRYYVTSAVGLQMYDPTGRMGGVIVKPQDAGLVSVVFGGADLAYLYVACGDTIYRRKTKSKGVLFFEKPEKEREK
ncbi:MAG: SMP-30/gluconolactonase/LRE family protein [Verrucomicrobiales bacterium]|nr:SMP-30/gluconolactonase/LRE family protein [Verrucomicrobiales bacterium]